ncbi:hypothetical protein BOA8489_04041 [Boseongicola aestuarii]|uniref:Uncharacterized protein n=1 Tax=Boseongicola aestuarii TaxID=1470561 RepID=A0A238J5G3_9RHOB|nr:hypothetical protein BOA8489_04041 [Boseongicola aestuarii]
MYTRSGLKMAIRGGKHRWPLLCQGGFRARSFSPARQRLQPALAFPAHMARFPVLCFSFPVPRISFPVSFRAGNWPLTHCFKVMNPAQFRSNRRNSTQNRSFSLFIPCKTGKLRLRPVRSGLRPPPHSPVSTGLFSTRRFSPAIPGASGKPCIQRPCVGVSWRPIYP